MKPGQKLEDFAALDADAFVEEVRKHRPKREGRLTPGALRALRSGYEEQTAPVREAHAEAAWSAASPTSSTRLTGSLPGKWISSGRRAAPPWMPRF